MSTTKKYSLVFLLSFMFSAAYFLPYIKYVFYEPLKEGLGANNQQIGMLVSVYAIINTITLIPGGWISDRFPAKKIILISSLGTGILNFTLAFFTSYKVAIVVWLLLSFTTIFAFWGAVIKAIRLLGDEHEQGRLYGFYAGFQGVVNTLCAFLATWVFSLFATPVLGLKGILFLYGGLNVVGAIIFYFLYPNDTAEKEGAEESIALKDVLLVLKMPSTWLLSLIIFSIYGLFSSSTYMTPYVTDVLKISGSLGITIAIFRTHIAKAVFCPLGGILSDKTKNIMKNISVCSMVTALFLLLMIIVSGQSNSMVSLIIILLSSVTIYMNFGVMWATSEELEIPRRLYGTVIGVASIIGYSPDLFMPVLFGKWMDNYGNVGYNYIFSFMIFLAAVGAVVTLYINLKKSKQKELSA